MADFTHNENSGSLFVNARKTRDNHPDRTGSGLVKCPHCGVAAAFRMSGWVKPGKNGRENWLSVAFTPEEEGTAARQSSGGEERPAPIRPPATSAPGKSPYEAPGMLDEDDIPF